MRKKVLMWFFRCICRLHSKLQDILFPRFSSPESFGSRHPWISPWDISVKLVPHNANWKSTETLLAELQAFSINHNLETGEVEGSLLLVLCDTDPLDKCLAQAGTEGTEGYDLLFRGLNEYGAFAEQRVSQVRFTNWSYGMSIDDIVTEPKIDFRASGIQRWARVERGGEKLEG